MIRDSFLYNSKNFSKENVSILVNIEAYIRKVYYQRYCVILSLFTFYVTLNAAHSSWNYFILIVYQIIIVKG